jgi:hypothetical protein
MPWKKVTRFRTFRTWKGWKIYLITMVFAFDVGGPSDATPEDEWDPLNFD